MKSKIIPFFLLFYILFFPSFAFAQSKEFTAEELATFDGKDGRSAYFAYEGKVYDVTGSPVWKLGNHFGLQAGQDLTAQMDGAPHGVEVFVGLKEVGTFAVTAEKSTTQASDENAVNTPLVEESAVNSKWFEGRIRLFGISVLGWTGILLGVFFVFTFATCFAMPWAKLPLPWKGSKLGPDPLDANPNHMGWSSIHKHFVWWTVIFGMIHGILGFLQLFGIYL